MAIISVSGRINSGKDTVGKISQLLIEFPHFTNEAIVTWLDRDVPNPKFEIKKFADSLKDIICLFIGCTRAQLEDREFKEKELPEEWWYYKLPNGNSPILLPRGYYPNQGDNNMCEARYLVKPTPRLLLQQLGTECGRNILHPNLWVNALFSKYQLQSLGYIERDLKSRGVEFPNWIITDMRFPNELKAVKDRGGVSIRVNRSVLQTKEFETFQHPSETALDNAEFNYTINNNGIIEELIDKVKEILIKEKIINVSS